MIKGTLYTVLLLSSGLFLSSCKLIQSPFQVKNSYQCEEPITYRIGEVDQRFEISRDWLKKAVIDASEVWSDATSIKLGEFSEDGEVTINLIYDERQKNARQAYDYRKNLVHNTREIDRYKYFYYRWDNRYRQLKSDLSEAEKNYAESKLSYEELAAKLIQKQEASADDKREIMDLKNKMVDEKEILNDKQEELKGLVERINENKHALEELVNENNKLIEEYNDKFIGKPLTAQGSYQVNGSEKNINIYRFLDLVELRLIIAHEMGHAMGLDHVPDNKAIMYYKTVNESNTLLRLTDQDISAIASVCNLEG